jgi:hypothetical protein
MMMKNEFQEYFNAIGISDPLLTQLRNMYLIAQRILGEEIESTFIGDSKDQGGVRNYLYIFFFAEKRFAYFTLSSTTQCYVYGWRGLFPIARTIFEDYDFQKAKETSRLQIVLANESLIASRPRDAINFQATGDNCDYLFRVYKEIIFPHL